MPYATRRPEQLSLDGLVPPGVAAPRPDGGSGGSMAEPFAAAERCGH